MFDELLGSTSQSPAFTSFLQKSINLSIFDNLLFNGLSSYHTLPLVRIDTTRLSLNQKKIAMSLTVKKYLELPEGTTIALNKESFVVKGFGEIDGRREPVLVNVADGARLYGGLYVAHLMRIDSSVEVLGDPYEYFIENSHIPVIRAQSSLSDFDVLMQMSIDELGYPDDLFYCSERESGRPEHPLKDQYYLIMWEFYQDFRRILHP